MPTCILAKTFKGKDFPNIENLLNWHGKALGDKTNDMIAHLETLIKNPGGDKLPIQASVYFLTLILILNSKYLILAVCFVGAYNMISY